MKHLLLSFIFLLVPCTTFSMENKQTEKKNITLEQYVNQNKENTKNTLLGTLLAYTTTTASITVGGCTLPFVPLVVAGGLTLYAGKKTYDYMTAQPKNQGSK